MKPDKILFLDTETGGIDPATSSLLSIGLVIWQEGTIIDSCEILINDGKLNVTTEALEINGISIAKHKKVANTSIVAVKKIDAFLTSHFPDKEKITLAGHNINFDINFLRYFLVTSGYNFNARFSHRYIDTASILYYLYLSGKLDSKVISSQEAFDFFKISVTSRHSALGDAIATAQLFNALLRL
jgi:DNA polymerase III alpha subunit (gram-positive type)